MAVTSNSDLRLKCVAEVTALQQAVWQVIEDGRVDTLQADPTYVRIDKFNDELVRKIVAALEVKIYQFELDKYLTTHRGWQGVDSATVLVTPQFDKMPINAQWYLVTEMDRIFQRYQA